MNTGQFFNYLYAGAILLVFTSCKKHKDEPIQDPPPAKPAILVFSKTAGYHHASIPQGIAAIQQLGKDNNVLVDTTTNADYFITDTLKKYKAVVFLSTTGDVLNNTQQTAFQAYIHSGGNFMGIHSATDTEHGWTWYGELVGAVFTRHPNIQQASLNKTSLSHVSTSHLPSPWVRTDEWYNFKNISTTIQVILTIDETSYTGGENGDPHPMAWYHEFEGGKSYYTALGHTPESYSDPVFLQHLLGGIKYVTGK